MRVQIVIFRLVITSLNMEIGVCYRPKADTWLMSRAFHLERRISFAEVAVLI